MADDKIRGYPLQWPVGWKRSATPRRTGKFLAYDKRITIAAAIDRVVTELQRQNPSLHEDDIVISTNRPRRLNGNIDAAAPEPGDVGVAVYWQYKRQSRVIAIDTYDRIADNIAAVGNTLDAMRAIERHGGAVVLERVYTGLTALPAPAGGRPWPEVLNCDAHASNIAVRHAYRVASSAAHPDKSGGGHERMAEVNAAFADFKRERGL